MLNAEKMLLGEVPWQEPEVKIFLGELTWNDVNNTDIQIVNNPDEKG